MPSHEVDYFKIARVRGVGKDLQKQANDLRVGQRTFFQGLPDILTPTGRRIRHLEQTITQLKITEANIIDAFRSFSSGDDVSIFSTNLLTTAEDLHDRPLYDHIRRLTDLPADQRYDEFRDRLMTPHLEDSDSYMLNAIDAISLALAFDIPTSFTVPLSPQERPGGLFSSSEVRTNIIGVYQLLGLPIVDSLFENHIDQIMETHRLSEPDVTITFGFNYDYETVKNSNAIPFATLSVSRNIPPDPYYLINQEIMSRH